MRSRDPILSFAILCFFPSLPCVAQDVVPVIRLSVDEAAKAKQLAQTLKDAKERATKAKLAWEQFSQSYQTAHPDLLTLRFTDDLRFAVTRVKSSTAGIPLAATIELTAEERKKLESLHREMTESEQSQKQAQNAWKDFNIQLVVDHVPVLATDSYSEVALSSHKQVRIRSPWIGELLFTTDFKLAFPPGF
jgi:putative lipoic acid-binding regulatory protein